MPANQEVPEFAQKAGAQVSEEGAERYGWNMTAAPSCSPDGDGRLSPA